MDIKKAYEVHELILSSKEKEARVGLIQKAINRQHKINFGEIRLTGNENFIIPIEKHEIESLLNCLLDYYCSQNEIFINKIKEL